ncbi:MAG: hypothetical protein NC311_01945 [Muribaculaceae bacterium]|nr:hypothetical protein [Muribaculaceae bacterium]
MRIFFICIMVFTCAIAYADCGSGMYANEFGECAQCPDSTHRIEAVGAIRECGPVLRFDNAEYKLQFTQMKYTSPTMCIEYNGSTYYAGLTNETMDAGPGLHAMFQNTEYVTQNPDKLRPYMRRLEYIQATGTQYIDTGYYVQYGIPASVTMVISDAISNDSNREWNWTGANALLQLRIMKNGYDTTLSQRGSEPVPFGGGKDKLTEYFDGRYTYLDINDAKTVQTQDWITYKDYGRVQYGIFVLGYPSWFANTSLMKLYSLQLTINNILVRDYVPVLDWDGRPALYDFISNKLFYNIGSGEFLYGEIK